MYEKVKSARIDAFRRFMDQKEHRGRVLIVEDDEYVSASLSAWMKRCGMDAVCVHLAEDGIAVLEREEFDLVLVNLILPKMPGKNLIEWCNTNRPQLPCIVVSGLEIEDMVRACTSLKIVMALQKPVQLHDVENLLLQLNLHMGDDQARI